MIFLNVLGMGMGRFPRKIRVNIFRETQQPSGFISNFSYFSAIFDGMFLICLTCGWWFLKYLSAKMLITRKPIRKEKSEEKSEKKNQNTWFCTAFNKLGQFSTKFWRGFPSRPTLGIHMSIHSIPILERLELPKSLGGNESIPTGRGHGFWWVNM